MTIKLIGLYLSPFVLRVITTLNELGLSYELDTPDDLAVIKTPEFLATKHPFGKLPVLIDDDFTIYETRAIIRYLVKKYQGTKNSTVLIPSDVQKAAFVDQFISVQGSYYDEALRKLVKEEVFIKYRGKSPNPEIIKEALEEVNKVLDVYEKLLEGKEYIAGEFSLADIDHYPTTHYAITAGYKLWNDPKRPNIARWWKNISERECWKKVSSKINLNPGEHECKKVSSEIKP